MKRIELLVNQIRRNTENNDTNGISTDDILQYANDAQTRLQSLIHEEHPDQWTFAQEWSFIVQTGQDTYDLRTMTDPSGVSRPTHIFNGTSIALVEYSQNGGAWIPLPYISPKERTVGFGYFLKDYKMVIAPVPASFIGTIRCTIIRSVRSLDVRRGLIGVVAASGSENASITLSGVPTGSLFSDIDYISINDRDGVSKLEEVQVISYTAGTGGAGTLVVKATPSQLTTAGITAANGFYVLYGGYSTTNSELSDICERYLIEYPTLRIQMRDSSRDIVGESSLLTQLEEDIVECYATMGEDNLLIPINSTDYLYY